MSSDLILGFTRCTCSSLRQKDRKRSVDGSQKMFDKACQSFFALLHSIDPLVRSRPFLLPPLWRGLCDLAVCLSEVQNSDDATGSDRDGRLALDLALNEASASLLSYMREGEAQAREGLVRHVARRCLESKDVSASSPPPPDTQQRQHQIKVFIFLAARLSTLLPLLCARCPRRRSCGSFGNAVGGGMDKLFDNAIETLARLRGIAGGASFLFRLRGSTGSHGDEDDITFIQPLEHLGHKLDHCFFKIAVAGPGLHHLVLDALLRLQLGSKNFANKCDDAVILSRASLSL
eukprot:3439823-Ditylum_brightwellii.AAC.1